MFSLADTAPSGAPASQRELAVRRGLGRRSDDAAATVEATLAAARTLIERDGVIDFNVRELLALAQVSNRAFYRHFPTKESVVAALVEEVYSTMVHSLAAAIERTDGAEARMAAWIDDALQYARDPGHRARGRVFVAYEARLRDEHPEIYRSTGSSLVQQVSAIIREGSRSGVFAAGAPTRRARIVVRLVVATLQHHVLERTVPTAAERDALVAFVIGACR